VLPDYGFEKEYLETYLRNLETTSKIIYMNLPGASDFKDPVLTPDAGMPSPTYPLSRLVKTFETLREELVAEGKLEKGRVAILAHGISGWIAMRYASEYPQSVKCLILVSTYSSGAAFGKGLETVEKNGSTGGDIEEEHWAQSCMWTGAAFKYQATNEQEMRALQRRSFTLYFANPRGYEIEDLYWPLVKKSAAGMGEAEVPKINRLMGSVMIPMDFNVGKEKKTGVPALVLVGANSRMTSIDDSKEIAKFYGGALEVFKESSQMPFIEENKHFVSIVRKVLR
jgi:pimeloyl-ACP methyl ester carboxylesterase